jgi:hypothetical protein
MCRPCCCCSHNNALAQAHARGVATARGGESLRACNGAQRSAEDWGNPLRASGQSLESEGFCCCFSARAGVADRTQHIHLRQCGGMAISVVASLQPGNLLCAFHVARTIWHPANLRIKMAIARLTLFRLGKRLLWPCRCTSPWALV